MRQPNPFSNRSKKKARQCHIRQQEASARADVLSARWRAHNAFDLLWKSGWCSRNEAYRMLAALLEIPVEQAHFSMFNPQQCEAIERHFEKMAPKERKFVSRRHSTEYRLRRRELQEADLE